MQYLNSTIAIPLSIPRQTQQKNRKVSNAAARIEVQLTMQRKEHLVVMVHGLNGHPSNWSAIQDCLNEKNSTTESTYLYFQSSANRKLNTFGGLRRCADRLSEEIIEQIKNNPSLKEISFLAHSLGGLISRFACGLHYNPKQRTIFKLRPCHFLSIASPHLGCHHDGNNEVPLISWGKKVPLLTPVFRALTPTVVPLIYRQTGRQLFLMDDHHDGMPLLCMLVQDCPEQGYFLSALKEFKTRTCYANVSGDGMVGWANASLRRSSELPQSMNASTNESIKIRSDPLDASLWTDAFLKPMEDVEFSDWSDRDGVVEYMTNQLQSMPWCRIDVKFNGMFLPFLAHTHIQVTRPWIDSKGKPVVQHIVDTFIKLEGLIKES
eukprot:g484.t1